jgi:hypothetical protein
MNIIEKYLKLEYEYSNELYIMESLSYSLTHYIKSKRKDHVGNLLESIEWLNLADKKETDQDIQDLKNLLKKEIEGIKNENLQSN